MAEFGRRLGTLVKQRYMLSVMCGRFTYRLTWPEIVKLYRLTLDQPARNTQSRYNVCPTTTIDTIIERNGQRELMPMRWGLVPSWWAQPLKELRLATFNARAETVTDRPFFRLAFKRNRCLIPVSGYYEWQDTPGGKQPWSHGCRWLACTDDRWTMGPVARSCDRGKAALFMHDDRHRAEPVRRRGARSNASVVARGTVRAVAVCCGRSRIFQACGWRTCCSDGRCPSALIARARLTTIRRSLNE